MEKALRHCKRCAVRAGCSKAEPSRSPPSRERGMAKIQSAGDGHYPYLQTQFGEDRCTQFRVIVVTDPQTNPQIHAQTGPITIHCAAKLSAQCNNTITLRRDCDSVAALFELRGENLEFWRLHCNVLA